MKTVLRVWSSRRLLLLVAAVLAAVALGYGIGAATAADPRLDEADAALQKADALLAASQSGGGLSDQDQHKFDKAVGRARDDVADARLRIAEAKAIVDNP
jgi:hypothetical protein